MAELGCMCSCRPGGCGRPVYGISGSYCWHCTGGQCGDWLDDPETPPPPPAPPSCWECGDQLPGDCAGPICPACHNGLESRLAKIEPLPDPINWDAPSEVLDDLWNKIEERQHCLFQLGRHREVSALHQLSTAIVKEINDRERFTRPFDDVGEDGLRSFARYLREQVELLAAAGRVEMQAQAEAQLAQVKARLQQFPPADRPRSIFDPAYRGA